MTEDSYKAPPIAQTDYYRARWINNVTDDTHFCLPQANKILHRSHESLVMNLKTTTHDQNMSPRHSMQCPTYRLEQAHSTEQYRPDPRVQYRSVGPTKVDGFIKHY